MNKCGKHLVYSYLCGRDNGHLGPCDPGKKWDEFESRLALLEESHEILDLVVAEWNSDPMSVQCFDLRIVQRAKELVAKLKRGP